MRRSLFSLILVVICAAGCDSAPGSDPVERVFVLERAPHDPQAYTQGLVIDGEKWLESTGIYGRSSLREIERSSGKILRTRVLPDDRFAEGLALHGDRLYQLTWKAGECIVYDRETFEELKRFSYQGEGWGLCSDGDQLFMSNGSSRISIRDPETFEERRGFDVVGAKGPVTQLNELELVRGELWANVWRTGWIVRINPENGRVLGFLDLHALPRREDRHAAQDVLNGIAWDSASDEIWITGKNWKAVYQIDWKRTPTKP